MRKLHARLSRIDAVDLALRLTLLDLLLHPIGTLWLRPLALGLAGAGLIVPDWLRRPTLWWILAAVTGLRVILDWPLADNHAYLLCYWCLAIALALRVEDTREALAFDARWLVGLAFAFATLWKVGLSPDYLDGTFFRVMLLADDRFEDFTRLFGGVSQELLESNRALLDRHVDGWMSGAQGGPTEPSRLLRLAHLATFVTVAQEAFVATTFLWPLRGRISRARHAALLVFCVTSYAVAPVEDFGWLLIAMGIAQCEPERHLTRGLYLAVFALLLCYREIPFAALLLER